MRNKGWVSSAEGCFDRFALIFLAKDVTWARRMVRMGGIGHGPDVMFGEGK